MPNTPIQYSTACPSPVGSENPVATLAPGQNFPVNFSGVTDSGGNPSTFTVGGWMRVLAFNTEPTVFVVNEQLSININTEGVLTVVLGSSGELTSDVPITDSDWHYVSVTYLPSTDAGETGVLALYIDGLEAAAGAVNVSGSGPGSGCYLGTQPAPLEFVSWTIWSQALPSDVVGAPQWGDPTKGTEAADGLVAAFDFAQGSAQDISGNSYAVSVAAQSWHTPCLELNDSGPGIATGISSNVNPGGGSGTPAPFSILGWACVPSPEATAVYPLLTNNDPSLRLMLSADGTGALSAGYAWGQNQYSTPLATGGWVHCALTWDGNSVASFYLNGLQANTQQITNPISFVSPEVAIGSADTGTEVWYLQGLSIWSTCLDQDSIDGYMQGADPTDQPGCVANFPLLTDLGDSINGNSLSVNNCEITELITSMTTDEAATETSVFEPVALDGPRLLLPQDLKAIAKKNGIDVDSPLSASDMASDDYAEIGKWFDGLTAKLPAAGAARLKNEFLRNARIGLELRRKGIKAGTFTMAIEGGDTVGYYHDESGPHEVYRLAGVALTPMQQWGMTILFDTIFLIVAMFGIVSSAAKVTKAVGLLEPEINQVVSAVQTAYNVSDSALLKAKNVTMAVIGVIVGSRLTYSVVKQIVIGSWWSLAFTITNTVLMIVALVVTDGAALIIRVVQMGVQLGTLVYDLMQMPQSEAAAASAY